MSRLPVGHVYEIAKRIFGIVVYRFPGSNSTEVRCVFVPRDMSVLEVCTLLAEDRAGEFRPADPDTREFGKARSRHQGFTEML